MTSKKNMNEILAIQLTSGLGPGGVAPGTIFPCAARIALIRAAAARATTLTAAGLVATAFATALALDTAAATASLSSRGSCSPGAPPPEF